MVVKSGKVSSGGGFDVCSTGDNLRVVSRVLQGKRRGGAEQGWVENVGRATEQDTVNASIGAACLCSLSFGAFLTIPKFSQGATNTGKKVEKGVTRVWGQGMEGTEIWRGPSIASTECMERDRTCLGSIDEAAKPVVLPEEEANGMITEAERGPSSRW